MIRQADLLLVAAHQQAQHAVAHVLNVGGPPGQQRIVEGGHGFGTAVDGDLPGAGGALLLVDALQYGVQQVRVFQDFLVNFKDSGFAGAGRLHHLFV